MAADLPSSHSERESEHEEYRACGDYSGTERTLPPSTSLTSALADAGTMTQADRVWIEKRRVVLGPWEPR